MSEKMATYLIDGTDALLKQPTLPSSEQCLGMRMPDYHNLIARWLERQMRAEISKMRVELGLVDDLD